MRYLKDALEDLYASDFGPTDRPCVFDVHHERPGGAFENVDLVAIHWRTWSSVRMGGFGSVMTLVLQRSVRRAFLRRHFDECKAG